jgi:hypothetical protein
LRNGLNLGETAFSTENRSPELVEVALLDLLLGRGLDLGGLVDGIELAALDGVEEHLGGLLDTLEEAVVLVTVAEGGLLIGVVTEHLLAVSTLDLLGGRAPAVLAQAENGIVILAL